jgi:hypothetical protein
LKNFEKIDEFHSREDNFPWIEGHASLAQADCFTQNALELFPSRLAFFIAMTNSRLILL